MMAKKGNAGITVSSLVYGIHMLCHGIHMSQEKDTLHTFNDPLRTCMSSSHSMILSSASMDDGISMTYMLMDVY